MLQVNLLEDCGKVPPAAILKEKVYVSTAYINCAQNFCISSINVGMSASLFYTPPPNVYSLIRPKTGNGLLIAQPGHNVFLRETFLSHLGDHKIWQWKANISWLALYRKLFSESNNHLWIQWNIYELPKLLRSKESTCQCRRNKRCGFNPWVRKKGSSFPGGGNGNPPQYSCLENYMDRGAWWATVRGVTKSQIQLSAWACTHQWNIYGKLG